MTKKTPLVPDKSLLKIAIVGAGLSGLSCAATLKEFGIKATVFDSSHHVGGRLSSEVFEGFIIDRGFQVILESYPELAKFEISKNLKIKLFPAGVAVQNEKPNGKPSILSDPRRDPKGLISSVLSSVGSIKDKLLLVDLYRKSKAFKEFNSQTLTEENLISEKKDKLNLFDRKVLSQQSTLDFLKNYGFSNHFIENFLKPLLAGILLEAQLATRADYFLFLFQCFARGNAFLPENGIGELPKAIASKLDPDQLRLKHAVIQIRDQTLRFAHGTEERFDHIVLAVDVWALKKLQPDLDLNTEARGTTTFYYTSNVPLFAHKYLWVNNSRAQRIVSIAPLSAIAPTYAPSGQHLYAVNTLSVQDEALERKINTELKDLFPHVGANLKLLKVHRIPNALPTNPLWNKKLKQNLPMWLLLAGDYFSTPCIDGALRSGRKTAEKLLAQLNISKIEELENA